MHNGNVKSYVNNTNEHAVQNLHMFFYSLGRWTRKCKGMRSTLWLFLRYVDGALMCVPSFSLMQKSYCSALQSEDTKNRHFNFISKVSTSKWQENCFILSTHKGLKKWLAHFCAFQMFERIILKWCTLLKIQFEIKSSHENRFHSWNGVKPNFGHPKPAIITT